MTPIDLSFVFPSAFPEESPEELRERKAISARCGHVKRRLTQGEPLTGELLDFAVTVVAEANISNKDGFRDALADKLRRGEKLDDYQHHIMVDVILLHRGLRGPSMASHG